MELAAFEAIIDYRVGRIRNTLSSKGKEYALTDDRLAAFKHAGLLCHRSPKQALLGMLAKHIISLVDMIEADSTGMVFAFDQWNEKITDAINYLILLEALVVEKKGSHEGTCEKGPK